MSMPGVQIPHWAPPVSRNACWSGESGPSPRQPLDGDDLVAVDLADRDEAAVDELAVEEDGARAALALAAALLGAGQAEVPRRTSSRRRPPGASSLDRGAVDA